MKKDFKKKKNSDLWKRFIPAYKKHKVKFVWVKGHAGVEENEVCDQLAVDAAMGGGLQIDTAFEEGGKRFLTSLHIKRNLTSVR